MEKMDIIVRKALVGDISNMFSLTKEAFKIYAEVADIIGNIPALEETMEDIKRDVANKECFVALVEGVIVGSVRVEVLPDNTAYLSRFGVKENYQSKGVGTVLMNAVDEAMENLGIYSLYLHTASKILTLIRFYYGRGFYIDSTTKDRGYIRAFLCKEYEVNDMNCKTRGYEECAV
jgi:GNAT superfamily N-acetyltransferase